MKKGICLLSIFILLLPLFTSCNQRKSVYGNGEYIEKNYETAVDVESIQVSEIRMVKGTYIVPIEVNIISSEEKYIKVIGQEEILDSINITSTFGILTIDGKNNTNYITESLKVYVAGYSISILDLELSTVNIDASCLNEDFSISLDYASDCTIGSFSGRSLQASLKSNSILKVDSLSLSSSFQINASQKSSFDIHALSAQDAKFTLDDESSGSVMEGNINNSIATLYDDSNLNIEGKIGALDLVMTGANYYGIACQTNLVDINVGYGKSIVEVWANDAITLNSAIGDCEVIYIGNPTVTKTNVNGNITIKKQEQGQE